MSFLYENFDTLSKFGIIPNKGIHVIENNLNPKFPIRDYQTKAFSRFDYFLTSSNFEDKPNKPFHLLYNMATGSGKTLIMAGLIVYLYEKGYRNFIFFVNSNNIISKTKENFLNSQTSKYLFNKKIIVNNKEVLIKEVNNFDGSDEDNINIKFTTIQQLHLDLNTTKENSITYEDLSDKRIVMLADEAHHLSSATKNNETLFNSWERTALKILNQNIDNILLEFTATLDYENREIINKYQHKVIFKYDLSQFRNDKYSKEIDLIRSLFDEEHRIVQALVLNLYRQELASNYNINLKPVILFKAKKTIKESEQNKINFHNLIDRLSAEKIDEIRDTSTLAIIQKAFNFFNKKMLTSSQLAQRIKQNFKFENCISANNDDESEKNQLLLNTLEDESNPIRAIFAVQKLNEGWDVLNLFDIVRLYETRDGKDGKIGTTTLSEAQLIGRGARYFPFAVEDGQEKFKRKYDDDFNTDLKILEELYYHTKEDSRYISELKKALIKTGIYEDEDNLETKELKLKLEFKKTELYKYGVVVFNKKVAKNYNNIKSFNDLGVKQRNYKYTLSSGFSKMTSAFFELEAQYEGEVQKSIDIKFEEIPKHIIRFSLSQNPFFYFDNIVKYFPNVDSLRDFIESKEYLGSLMITFSASRDRLMQISNHDYLSAITGLLQSIESEIKVNLTTYEGSAYTKDYIHNVFKDKTIKVQKGSPRADGQQELVKDEPWYAYDANYGTSEEKRLVEFFSRKYANITEKYDNVYMIRNEREIKIFDKLGRAFEPDFVLFCKAKGESELSYQVFIEPKGAHLLGPDNIWKEDFLKEMALRKETIRIDAGEYLITGVPFYRQDIENEFMSSFEEVLGL